MMENNIYTEAKKWFAFSTIAMTGYAAFAVLVGDENPSHPLPGGCWLVLKTIAAAALYYIYKTGVKIYNKGGFPEFINDLLKDDDL